MRHPFGTQFGHLLAKGNMREGTIRAMVVALKEEPYSRA